MNERSVSFVFALFLGSLAVAAVGCPKDGGSKTGGEQEPAEAAPEPVSRFSGDTKRFVDALTSTPATGWTVADEGASVVYDSLAFDENGSFEAATSVRLGDDPLDCTESGTWSLDDNKSDSRTEGGVTFQLTQTDCAGRTAPQTFRAHVTIADGDIDLAHR